MGLWPVHVDLNEGDEEWTLPVHEAGICIAHAPERRKLPCALFAVPLAALHYSCTCNTTPLRLASSTRCAIESDSGEGDMRLLRTLGELPANGQRERVCLEEVHSEHRIGDTVNALQHLRRPAGKRCIEARLAATQCNIHLRRHANVAFTADGQTKAVAQS